MIPKYKKLKKLPGLLSKKYHILILLLIGCIPILWYKQGYFIAKGDHFPNVFHTGSINNDSYLWSSGSLGNPSPLPASILYELLGASLLVLTKDIGLWQMIVHGIYFEGAVLSMFYLSKTIYPERKLTAIVAGVFYVFNIFTIQYLLNIGVMWIYAFLPLLIALFVRVLTSAKNVRKHIIFFAVAFTIVASISSINMADIALIMISLACVLVYYTAFERKIVPKQIIKNLTMAISITFLLSIWWAIPIINYYLLSSSIQLQQQVNVLSVSWTHSRASFLNLFWLNGAWIWRQEYSPYYNLYSNNVILSVLLFAPFLIASIALLFQDEKRKFNAYLMLIIVFFIFLAKGLHEPFGFVNLLLYSYVPYMNMFREPAPKFTLLMIPILALLIGYSAGKIDRILVSDKVGKLRKIQKPLVVGFILVFMVAAFPIFTNPIETKTEQVPYSSYVKIPQYWYETNDWLNARTGDFKILVTPLDDFYQVPYSWGYYGSDSFIERLIQKPVISPCYEYSYEVNPNMAILMGQLRDAIKYSRTEEFETLISLLNVKYVLQRNDLDYEYMLSTNRDIVNPVKMSSFLSTQPNIVLIRTIGKLDIYEYIKAKPYIYVLEPKQIQEHNIEITNKTVLALRWDFDSTNQLDEWKNTTLENQFSATCRLHLDNATLRFELWNSTWGWKTVNSPLITAQYGASYGFKFSIRGENARSVHLKVNEYDTKTELIHAEYVYYIADGTFNWKDIQTNYVIKNENTTFLQLSIWSGHETDKPVPNIIWIDNVQIYGYTTRLHVTGLNLIFQNTTQNQPATILQYVKVNPTKITATINATQRFILAIGEALDQSWKAYVNGKRIESSPLYLGLKGFYINQTGLLKVTIEYEPQSWFFYCSIISISTFLGCLTYLIYIYSRERDLRKRMRPFRTDLAVRPACFTYIAAHSLRFVLLRQM